MSERASSSLAVGAGEIFLTPELEKHVAVARELRARSRSDNTRRSYASGWRLFEAYMRKHQPGVAAIPADPVMVSLFLSSLHDAGRTAETIRARASAIAFYHREANVPSPCDHPEVKRILEGAIRSAAGRKHGRSTVAIDELEEILGELPPTSEALATRDRAMILLTFASGRRRSEIAALDVEQLDFRRNRRFLFIWVAKSKTDQRGRGEFVAVPRLPSERAGICAVVAIEAWLAMHPTGAGALFPSFVRGRPKAGSRIQGRVVADVLKRLCKAAGVSEERIATIAAHSLRRGFVTSADAAGMSFAQIGAVTGQKDPRTIARYAVHDKTKDPPLLNIIRTNEPGRD